CSRPRSVSGTAGVSVKTRSRLPSLSPWRIRMRRAIAGSAVAVHAIDQLPQAAEVRSVERQDEAGQGVQLGLVLLLRERVRLHDVGADQDVPELAAEARDELLVERLAQPEDEVPSHGAGRVVDAVEVRDLRDRLLDRGRDLEERHVVLRDELLSQQMVLDVALPRRPVRPARRVDEDDGHGLRLPRLDERQALVALVERAESAREERG